MRGHPSLHSRMASQRLSPRKAVGFLRRLVPRVRPYRAQLLVALVMLVVSTAVGLVFPLVVRQLLDAAFLAANGARLDRVAVGLLVLFAFQAVINFGQSYLMAGVSERVIADLRKDLFGHLALQPPGFFSLRRVGELSSRLAADPAMIQQVLRFGVPELMRQGLFLIGALTLVTLTNPRLTLVTLTAIPFAILVGWFFGRRVRKVSTSIQDTLAVAIARAEQVFTQIRVVQSFTRESSTGWLARSIRLRCYASGTMGREMHSSERRCTRPHRGSATLFALATVRPLVVPPGRAVGTDQPAG